MEAAHETQSLQDIWAEWGLHLPTPEAEAHAKAASALRQWLLGGEQEPRRIVRAVQVLLLDPNVPGVRTRPAFKEVRSAVQQHWVNAGAQDSDVQAMQALLLSAWPPLERRAAGIAAVLDSPWELLPQWTKRQAALTRWRNGIIDRDLRSSARDAEVKPGELSPAAPPGLSFSLEAKDRVPQAFADIVDIHFNNPNGSQIVSLINSNVVPNIRTMAQTLRETVALSQALSVDVQRIHDTMGKLDAYVAATAKETATFVNNAVNQSLKDALQRRDAEQELLWWGQARYSHRLHRPYRGLPRPQLICSAAYDVAERTGPMPSELVASYLVEVLQQLGLDVEHKQRLSVWFSELQDALRELPGIQGSLSSLLDDATGLPVSWLRQRGPGTLSDSTGMPPEPELGLGAVASLVFKEMLLERRLLGK